MTAVGSPASFCMRRACPLISAARPPFPSLPQTFREFPILFVQEIKIASAAVAWEECLAAGVGENSPPR